MKFDLKTHEGRIAALEQIAEDAEKTADNNSRLTAVNLAAHLCSVENAMSPQPTALSEAVSQKLSAARKDFAG